MGSSVSASFKCILHWGYKHMRLKPLWCTGKQVRQSLCMSPLVTAWAESGCNDNAVHRNFCSRVSIKLLIPRRLVHKVVPEFFPLCIPMSEWYLELYLRSWFRTWELWNTKCFTGFSKITQLDQLNLTHSQILLYFYETVSTLFLLYFTICIPISDSWFSNIFSI